MAKVVKENDVAVFVEVKMPRGLWKRVEQEYYKVGFMTPDEFITAAVRRELKELEESRERKLLRELLEAWKAGKIVVKG